MHVKITVSTSGKALNIGKSNSIVLKDVTSLEEVHEAINKEFKSFFPNYQTLDKTPAKPKKEPKT
ncbi:TPA_asm: hypothetical protein vir530_00012 [dsDNA virus vir530]|jgi:hypothetical protein|nr:TPA_asm: hypothetical protein vir530_00012 [dsDNA virus vir530]